jgi:hypothetical protein
MKTIISIIAAGCMLISCGSGADKQALIDAQQKTVDSMQTEMVKKQTIDSMNAVAAQPVPVNNEQPAQVSSHHSSSHPGVTHNSYTTNTTNYSPAPVPVATTPVPEAKKKKGWSAKAKGAVIGTGVGAITGAMVDKKKGEGAIVGGLAGAAVGLGAGAIIDKKKKDKEQADK